MTKMTAGNLPVKAVMDYLSQILMNTSWKLIEMEEQFISHKVIDPNLKSSF